YPVVAALSGGFFGLAGIFAGGSLVKDSVHLVVVSTLAMTWALIFGCCALVLLTADRLRRRSREILSVRPQLFFGFLAALYVGLVIAILAMDGPVFHSAERAAILHTVTFILAAATIPVLLIQSFRVYLRRRNPVVLFFTLGLYLYSLAILAQ